jgi:hypothetical protein
MSTSKTKKSTPKSVIITTSHRGVFWGYLESEKDRTVVLAGARNAILWNTKKGFVELADIGPNSGSRIGARAQRITLHDVTSITECTDAATKAWEAFA